MIHQDKFCHEHHLDGLDSNLVWIVIRQYFRIADKIISQISDQSSGKRQLFVFFYDIKLAVIFFQTFERISLPDFFRPVVPPDHECIPAGSNDLFRFFSKKRISVIIFIITFQKKSFFVSYQTLIHADRCFIYNADCLFVYP